MKNLVILFIVALTGTACSISPQPIAYGQEACHFCKMTIVDARYGAEVVISTGKAYKYDAAECLINHLNSEELSDKTTSLILVNTFDEPSTFTNAQNAYYLRSSKLPSPMGAYITPTTTLEKVKALQAEHSGEIFSWDELQENYSELPNLTENITNL